MNTRRSTGSIGKNKNNNNSDSSNNNNSNSSNNNNSIIYSNSKMGINSYLVASLTTKTITPELHAINTKICRLVEQHPCVYDRSHPSYMRKSHVDRAWEDISKEMNDSVDNCKERFRNIRTSFARSINVQRVTNRVKPYYLSEELEFLKRHITPGVPVPVKGRRSRDSSHRRGDENDEYDENDEDEPVEALVHIKHSLSSDEYVTEEGSSSEWVTDDAHAQEKPDESELHSQSDDDEEAEEEEEEQKPTNLLLQQAVNAAAATRACSSYPPKKRRRMVAELPAKASEPAAAGDAAVDPAAPNAATCLDFDDAFLQGLRPEMKHMNFHQKLFFKRRVYELLGEIFDGSSYQQQPYVNGQTPATVTVTATPATPSPTSLQHLGLLARSGALQLPKLAPKPSKDL